MEDYLWLPIIIVIVVVVVSIIIAIVGAILSGRGDYDDGGGKQVGGDNHVSFFAPANDRAGIEGENTANFHLRQLLRNDEYLLANTIITLRNGSKVEIDAILISRKGVFCVETKKWVGTIRGDDDDEYWTQIYDDPYMSNKKHKNPVKQNEGHCKVLDWKLGYKYDIENVVIFVDLENYLHSDYAFTIYQFKNYYRDLEDNVIPEEELAKIYDKLIDCVATKEELRDYKNSYH